MDTSVAPHRRVSIGQGFVTEVEAPKLKVRIRSGSQVGSGGYLGNQKRPTAFVWMDEEAAVPAIELVVKVGRSDTYLWQNGRAASLRGMFPKDKPVARLEDRLDDWQRYFKKSFNPANPYKFYWGRFHEEGRKLARDLQAVLIDRAVVRYQRPDADPQAQYAPEIEL